MRWIGCFGAVVILGATVMTPAFAQPAKKAGAPRAAQKPAAKAADSSNKDLAQLRLDKATAAEKAGNSEDAYAEYRAAYALYAHWPIAVSLADTAVKLGKYREAIDTYGLALADPEAKKELTGAARTAVEKKLAEAQAKVGTLSLTEAPAGAEIWIDGQQAGVAPLGKELTLTTGPHDIEARKGGAVVAKLHVEIGAGKLEAVTLREGDGLPRAVVPVPSGTAVATAPPVGPAATATAPTGSSGGGGAGGKPPTTDGGGTGPSWPAVIALGGLAVAGLGAGVGLWVVSGDKGAEAEKLYAALPALPKGPCKTAECNAVHDALAGQAGLQTGAAVAWGVAGAAGAAAVAVYVITGRTPARTGARVIPVVSAGTGGLIVEGSW